MKEKHPGKLHQSSFLSLLSDNHVYIFTVTFKSLGLDKYTLACELC